LKKQTTSWQLWQWHISPIIWSPCLYTFIRASRLGCTKYESLYILPY